MNRIKSFEDLDCWKACRELRLFVSRNVVPSFPEDEKFGLKRQILNSSRSTTANIAEGYGRFHYKDNYKFCSNSRGSCHETLDHLITAFDDSFISEEIYNTGRIKVENALLLLNGYMKYLNNAANNSIKEEHAEYTITQ